MCKCVYTPTSSQYEVEGLFTRMSYMYIIIMHDIYIESNIYAPRLPQDK